MATFFEITELPKSTIAGFQHQFLLRARLANGNTDVAYTGTVTFTSTDPIAVLPADYTFTGAELGEKLFDVRFFSSGARVLLVSDGSITGRARTTVQVRTPGWGLDDEGLLPYGDAVAGIGSFVTRALAVSTREVDVTVSGLVQDNSPFLPGDALNPVTWVIQRLDSAAFLTPVQVTQISTYTYRVLVLEEFGPASVTHRISSSTLLDTAGNPIVSPRQADFLGILDEDKVSNDAVLAKRRVTSQDLANSPVPQNPFFGGTLQVTTGGDYKSVSGSELTRKLLLRRYYSKPRDFFHLPNYGVGLRGKEPIRRSQLSLVKARIEQQSLAEPEVELATAVVTLDSDNVLTVKTQIRTRVTGEGIVSMSVKGGVLL